MESVTSHKPSRMRLTNPPSLESSGASPVPMAASPKLAQRNQHFGQHLGWGCPLGRSQIDLDARRRARRSPFARHEVEREPRVRLGEAIEGAAMDGGRVLAAANLGHGDVTLTANGLGDFDTTVEAELRGRCDARIVVREPEEQRVQARRARGGPGGKSFEHRPYLIVRSNVPD